MKTSDLLSNAWFQNISVEILGIIITVALVDHFIRKREVRRWRHYEATYLLALYEISADLIESFTHKAELKSIHWAYIGEKSTILTIDIKLAKDHIPKSHKDSKTLSLDKIDGTQVRLRFLLSLMPIRRHERVEEAGFELYQVLGQLFDFTKRNSEHLGLVNSQAFSRAVSLHEAIQPFITRVISTDKVVSELRNKGQQDAATNP